MSSSPRILAKRSAAALVSNFLELRRLVPTLELLPMIKADAYGHGATWAARTLLNQRGLAGFGVATLDEAQVLRFELGAAGEATRILVFSSCHPWRREYGDIASQFGITPVLGRLEDFKAFVAEGWAGKVPYHLKFNTGMNRLGIGMNEVGDALRFLSGLRSDQQPEGVLSHLAQSEAPKQGASRAQLSAFERLRSELSSRVGQARFHLANSGAILSSKAWKLESLTHWARPGIALYGVSPSPKISTPRLRAVQSIHAKILNILNLKKGDRVGYGGTFVAPRAMRLAIVGAGYADGVPRALSGRGQVFVNGRSERILGMVSMDLCAVGCAPETKVGDYVEVLGPQVDPWRQAKAAGTIPYELLTNLAVRERRVEQLDDSSGERT